MWEHKGELWDGRQGTLGPHLLSFHHFLNLHSCGLLYHNEFFSFSLCSLEEGHRQRWSWGGTPSPAVHLAEAPIPSEPYTLTCCLLTHDHVLLLNPWASSEWPQKRIMGTFQSFEPSRKFLLLWELSSLPQLTGASPSSCVYTTTPSPWPQQVGLESGMRHNQFVPLESF